MKFFVEVRKPLAFLGLNRSPSLDGKTLNRRNVLAIVLVGQVPFFTVAFVFFSAKSFKEYADGLNNGITYLLMFILLLSYVWWRAKMLDIIKGFGIFTEKRKSMLELRSYFV